jgi:hypothetical protein
VKLDDREDARDLGVVPETTASSPSMARLAYEAWDSVDPEG